LVLQKLGNTPSRGLNLKIEVYHHGPEKIRVRQIAQEATAWCWAAAAEMVLRYYHGGDVHHVSWSTNSSTGRIVAKTLCLMLATMVLTLEMLSVSTTSGVSTATLESRSVGFSKLKDEIEAERPVEVVYKLDGGFEHAVIVRGYREDQDGDFVIFNDPDPFREVGDLPFEDFKTAEGKGYWWRTWTEIEPE
jgi:hypothetical protein